MSDKKDQKESKRIYLSPLPDEIPSDRNKTYPADIVREAYRRWDGSIKSFCRRFGLSKRLVEKYIASGDWNRLQDEYRKQMYNILKKDRLELIEMKQNIIQRVEFLALVNIERNLQDIEEYVAEHGDFFVRDGDGEIARDSYGNPISRKIGMNSHDMKFLKEAEITREENSRLLKEADQQREQEELEEGSTTIEGYLSE